MSPDDPNFWLLQVQHFMFVYFTVKISPHRSNSPCNNQFSHQEIFQKPLKLPCENIKNFQKYLFISYLQNGPRDLKISQTDEEFHELSPDNRLCSQLRLEVSLSEKFLFFSHFCVLGERPCRISWIRESKNCFSCFSSSLLLSPRAARRKNRFFPGIFLLKRSQIEDRTTWKFKISLNF